MDGSTVSSKVVRGKRVTMWRRFRDSPGMMLWVFASPPALIVAAIKLLFYYSKLSTGATILYVLIALVAIGGLISLSVIRQNNGMECECPSCGAIGWFEFMERSVENEPRVARCDKCLIYAGLNGNDVAELPLEALITMPNFEIDSDQYEAHAQRGKTGRFEFAMPAFCAMCGSADAPHQRRIHLWLVNTDVNIGLVKAINYAYTGSPAHGLVQNSVPDRLSNVMHVQVPVCTQHQAATTRPEPLATDDGGTLCCASYRFYKAFVVANNVLPPGNEALPEARVRS